MSTEAKRASVEQEENRIRGVPVTLILLAATLIGTGLVLWGWVELRAGERAYSPGGLPPVEQVETMPTTIGGVRQTLIDVDTSARRIADQGRERLEGYGWVDSAQGIARIPIELAMRAVIEGARP